MTKVSLTVAEGATLPSKGSEGSGGFDLYANITEAVKIAPGETALIPTGVKMDPGKAKDLHALIIPRSGLGHKQGLVMGNGVGFIDNDYRGELFVSAHNRNSPVVMTGMGVSSNNKKTITIEPGMRLAQLVFIQLPPIEFNIAQEVSETERGDGGFGSTGE